MENRRQVGSSSASTTADIFGNKKSSSPSSSARNIDSIFPPRQVAERKNGSDINESRSKSASVNQAWSSGNQGSTGNKDVSMYQEDRGQPCNLSSSLYYGGQEVYSSSPNNQNRGSGSYPIFKKDGEEDDSNGTAASRGNWWQGSLYY